MQEVPVQESIRKYLLSHKALGIRKKKMASTEDGGKHHQKIFKAFNTYLFYLNLFQN